MKYRIAVTKVKLENIGGLPSLTHRRPLIMFNVDTSTNQEIELLYILTAPTARFHRFLTKYQPDGYYLLTVLKQTVFNPNVFKYDGYALVRKTKDMIFWENKYMQVGTLNALNLVTRDPQEEVKRTNWYKVPGTLDIKEPTLQERLDRKKGVHR